MDDPKVDRQQVTEHLSEAVKFRTVSYPEFDPKEFNGLHDYLERSFPRVHKEVKKETVGGYSLLYTWKGEQEALDPVLLMAHMDVFRVRPGTEQSWTHPPFSGNVADGYIWGRGTLDYKVGLLASLEAVEALLRQGHPMRRTIQLAFGHDEEIGGGGAVEVAGLLRSRGIRLHGVVDEGMSITDGIVPGVTRPVALVGLSEKGLALIELSVKDAEAGHSMAAPQHTAIGILATAVEQLEQKRFPAHIDGPTLEMIRALAPEMPPVSRMVLSNLWLFGGLVCKQFSRSPATNAVIRTTSNTTVFVGGDHPGSVPMEARAILRLSILPGDSIATATAHIRKVIDDPRVSIKPFDWTSLGIHGFNSQPSPVSNMKSSSFALLKHTIQQVFPDVLVAPGLVIAATDSRHFVDLSDHIFRFCPFRLYPADIARIHGIDERISVDDYERIVKFYIRLLRNWAERDELPMRGDQPKA